MVRRVQSFGVPPTDAEAWRTNDEGPVSGNSWLRTENGALVGCGAGTVTGQAFYPSPPGSSPGRSM
jgi:hypothetical protein